jgi:2-oxoglutarate ferredoxin oxidoreductase subunit alpha
MAERKLFKGNEAVAEAAVRAGCRYFFGYPITPIQILLASMRLGADP